MLAHQCLQKPDAGLWRDALALRALVGGISAGVSCSARTAMSTAMGRIEASAQVEPLPVFCRLFCPLAHTGAPGAAPPARPLAAPAGLVRNELVASNGPNLTRGAGTRTRNSATPRRAAHDAS